MKPKISAYIATSVDGFIAKKDGDLSWLTESHDQGGEDYGYREFMDSVDVLVMGRKTYEQVLTFGEWPYAGKKVVVLSTGAPSVPDSLRDSVTVLSLGPKDLVERLSAEGANHLYIDGGITIQCFIAAGLIDEITITIIPILIGEGTPLFGALGGDVRLTHIVTRQFESGYVQSKYRFATGA